MGDDSFDYFRDWLIGRGRAVFERVLADPDELADVASFEEEMDAESLRYAVQQAHERTHGAELPWMRRRPLPLPGNRPARNGMRTTRVSLNGVYPASRLGSPASRGA